MRSVRFPRPFVPTDPGSEALELRDVGASDLNVQDADAFPPDADYTPDDDDAMRVQYLARIEDERRAANVLAAFKPLADAAEAVRVMIRPAGFREAACLGCGTALYVCGRDTADPLCRRCEQLGNVLADDDRGPKRPGGGYAAALTEYSDDDLIAAVADVDEHRYDDGRWVGIDASNPEAPDTRHATIPSFILKTPAQKDAFLAAATAELLHRLDRSSATPALAA